jgi:hypothetical protein
VAVLVPAVLGVVAVGGAIARSSAAEPATVLGSLTVVPPTGTADQTNLRLQTISSGSPAGCPSGATRYTVSATGPGAWSTTPAQFTGGTSSTGSEFEVPLTPSFAALASARGVALEAGRYDLTVTCTTRLGQSSGVFTQPIWFTDPTHYQSTDPATTTTLTTVSVADAPQGRSELAEPVTLTATVTPATATGKVQFTETVNDAPLPFGAPVTVSNGTAQLVVRDFTFGLHLMRASFTPADSKRFTPSVSPMPELVHVVAKPVPPGATTSPSVTGTSAVGQRLTCSVQLVRATSMAFAWLRRGVVVEGATAPTYAVTATDRGSALACRVTAANAGGEATWTSPSRQVTG